MDDLSGKVAAITGAASGIGRALSLAFADQGCHLALADLDFKGLRETARMLDGGPTQVTTHQVDVACRNTKRLPRLFAFAHSEIGRRPMEGLSFGRSHQHNISIRDFKLRTCVSCSSSCMSGDRSERHWLE